MGLQDDQTSARRLAGSSVTLPLRRTPPRPSVYAPLHPTHAQSNLALEYYRILARHRKSILAFALGGAVLGFLIHLGSLPVYRARTSLDIQNLNGDFMDMRTVAATGEEQNTSPESYVQTQIKMLQSDTLLERTVQHLKAQPHPAAVPRNDLLSRWKRALHLPGADSLPYLALLDNAAKGTKVKPLGITRLVEITCDSWDPQFAASFCNTLTNQFREQDQEVRENEAQKTSDWLTRQVGDVRIQAEDLEKKLDEATGGNGLVLSQVNTNVSEDRLRQIQSELVVAQGERMEKEAQLRESRATAPDSIPAVADSPVFRAEQEKLNDLNSTIAELVPPLTEQNPKVIHLRSQIREVQGEMAAERASVINRMNSEYLAALHHEDLLSVAYSAQASSASGELDKANKVSLLRREVEQEQQLYQTLLQRAKEAGFASAMQVTTTRVVDAAKKPKLPVEPRRAMSIVVGMLLGGLVGIGFVFVKDRVTEVLRAPGDIQRYLQMDELGVIPVVTQKRTLGNPRAPGGVMSFKISGNGSEEGRLVEVTRWSDRFSISAEAYRNTTYSILLTNGASKKNKIYVISSPNSGEGKTTVVSNLGVALSQSRRRVVLIDGDLRKPGLYKTFEVSNKVGLRNVLRDEVDLSQPLLSTVCQPTNVPNLWIVPPGSGHEEVHQLLHSTSMSRLLERLASEFDVVLIDTPPMLHMSDARIFAGQADGAILVFRASVTTHEQAAQARDLFERDQVNVVGTILNAFDPIGEGMGNYYKSYYAYQEKAEGKVEIPV